MTTSRRRITAATLLIAAAAAGPLAAAPANADPTTYLAIVYSPTTGAYGWANGSASPADLRDRAMQHCQNAGGTDCRFLGNAVNSCGALAIHVGRYDKYRADFNHPTRIEADAYALVNNHGGYILVSRCSTGDDGIG